MESVLSLEKSVLEASLQVIPDHWDTKIALIQRRCYYYLMEWDNMSISEVTVETSLSIPPGVSIPHTNSTHHTPFILVFAGGLQKETRQFPKLKYESIQ